ncbi:MAG TPA: hypothetical protein VK581_01460 [Chthoniobacterales bacterium]|nr:hypothetical protein [Chthoniobacterales bacterium]
MIEVGFGVVDPLTEGDGAGEEVAGAEALWGAGLCASGVAIGLAGAGFFCDNSATVNFMASLIGIRATPLVLSTHPYVVKALLV